MKKTLALILAAMMVAGTSAVAFAATPDVAVDPDSPTYVWDSEERIYVVDDNIEYGDSLAFDLTGVDAQKSSKNKGYKVFPDWSVGESLVEDARIEKVKVQGAASYSWKATMTEYAVKSTDTALIGAGFTADVDTIKLPATVKIGATNAVIDLNDLKEGLKTANSWTSPTDDAKINAAADFFNNGKYYTSQTTYAADSYRYMAIIDLKDSTTTKVTDLVGDVRVAKTTSAAKNVAEEGYYVSVNLEVKHPSVDAGSSANDSITVDLDSNTVNYVLDIEDDADVTDIEFGKDGGLALFTVDLNGQSDINVGYSTKFNADIADKYPEANLEFLNYTAKPVFNRTGDLYIYADEDSFIYEVTADGLKEISKAEYDEDYGAWYLRTRKLTSYVISDVELDLSASSEASSSETSSSNPVTGGTTGTTEGNTNVKPNPNTGR